jgi:hypothetical protein
LVKKKYAAILRELINLTKYTNKKNTKQIQTLGPFSNNRKIQEPNYKTPQNLFKNPQN